jgi:hypothetical protein
MSARIRGQEATIRITVADEFAAAFGIFGTMVGSFFKVRDFSLSPRQDLVEQEYLGEDFDDLDFQHHGHDFSFTVDELDESVLNFLSLVTFKEAANLAPPIIGVSATFVYRNQVTLPQTVRLVDCVLKLAERSIGGRKEYIQNSFEGKAKYQELFIG